MMKLITTIERPSNPASLPAITVSGFLGSGARDIAVGVARELHVDYVDEQIDRDAARELGVSVHVVERRGTCARGIRARIDSALRGLIGAMAVADTLVVPASGIPEYALGRSGGYAAATAFRSAGSLDDRSYLATLTSVVKGIAARGNVVILGHGSEAILQHEPHTLRVFINAPYQRRVDALLREGFPERDAQYLVRQDYEHRRAFNRHFFKLEFESCSLYDMVIQTDWLSHDLAARIISVAARSLMPRAG